MAARRTSTVQAETGRQRREATQGDILEATKRLLERGDSVESLSIERIVAEAGVARRTFYLHFRDKRELIGKLAEDQIAWREQVGAEVMSDPEVTREQIYKLLDDIVQSWVANQSVLSAMIEVAEYDDEMRETWDAALDVIAGNAAEHLRRRWENSPEAPPDIDAIARVVTLMLERCCHQVTRQPELQAVTTDAMAEIAWRLLDYRR